MRVSARLLRKSPGFFLTSTFTLALGIAATTAMFSVVNAVLLRLPFGHPDRLVRFTAFDPAHQVPLEVSFVEIEDWRRANRTLDDVAGIGSTNWSYVLDGDDPQLIRSTVVSGNFFDVIESRPLIGRTLTREDDHATAARVVILSHALWRSRFAADPSVVGRAIRLSGSTFTIVGVMPAIFQYPTGTDIWTPIAPELAAEGRRQHQDLLNARWFGVLHGIGRLKDATATADAQTDLSTLIRRESLPNGRVQLTPLVDSYFGRVRTALLMSLASVFLLLAIACSNVAGLLLARTARRRQEWAVRRAVGGTDGAVVRLVMVDAAFVALTATLAGAIAAPRLVNAIRFLDPTGLVAGFPIPIDRRVIAVTITAGMVTLIVAGIGPCFHALRMAAADSISLDLRHRPSILRMRRWLIVGQVAVAVLLLASAGVMARSVSRIHRIDLGFDPERLLFVHGVEPSDTTRERHDAAIDRLIADVARLPGVENVAGVYRAPLQGPIGLDSRIVIEGDPLARESWNRHPPVNAEGVTPEYFSTMRIRLLVGRGFTAADGRDSPGVVVISESLARQLWPGQTAVGRRMLSGFSLRAPRDAAGRLQWETVVGIVADVRYREIEQTRFDVYVPVAQADAPVHDLVIRTSGDPSAVAASVRSVVRQLVPSSTPTTKTMTSMLAEATSVWRLTLIIIGTFAAFAVLLSATGLYGLLAYVVEERRRDIGIRIALGAAPGQIRWLVIANAGALVAVGLALGVPAFLLVGSAMRSLVFEVSPTDSFAVGGAVLLLASVGMVATYVPAWRASLVDPVETLRAE